MAAIPTRYSVGNQAERIVQAFASQNFAGGIHFPDMAGMPGGMGGWLQDVIGGATDFIQSRWGTPPGTVIQRTPQGEVIYRQPEGSATTLPIIPGQITAGQQQIGVQTPEGFSTGMALALGAGLVAVVLLSRGGRRR